MTLASRQQLVTVSVTRPMPWVSAAKIEIAPRSWSMSSPAMVPGRTRLSAKATSSGSCQLRKWASIVIGSPSSSAFRVKGLVGLVDEGRQ